VDLGWTVAGFGDISGNANETDMLMRNSSTGAFEVYDISHNQLISAVGLGGQQIGLDLTVAGLVTNPPAGSSNALLAQLVQAMASFGASGAVSSAPVPVGGADMTQQTLLTIPH
jgi:hypothetical protein